MLSSIEWCELQFIKAYATIIAFIFMMTQGSLLVFLLLKRTIYIPHIFGCIQGYWEKQVLKPKHKYIWELLNWWEEGKTRVQGLGLDRIAVKCTRAWTGKNPKAKGSPYALLPRPAYTGQLSQNHIKEAFSIIFVCLFYFILQLSPAMGIIF